MVLQMGSTIERPIFVFNSLIVNLLYFQPNLANNSLWVSVV